MNRLSSQQSSYLKSASHQPVDWFPWGDEPFARASEEGKPILLDIGAVWCHWCHVMDAESYENPSIARLINEHFIAIKVDRDERPDIDARYQSAVGSIAGQGGWPLTGFLLPDGRVFYGGTYFPPEDRHGRPGFPTVLNAIADAFQGDRERVVKNAELVENALRSAFERTSPELEIAEPLLLEALDQIRSSLDEQNGGFGTAPKFPHPGAIELLLSCYDRTREPWMIDAAAFTLKKMALGGVHDQLGGGFHRYSTDERWVVPHFEKMLYDNAPLLLNYLHTFQATGDSLFKSVSRSIVDFVKSVLCDQYPRGFYSSQDADVTPGDDGSYFTWTATEAQSTLSQEEFAVLELHYNLYENGEMQHDRRQNVLFVDKSTPEIADLLGIPLEEVDRRLESGRARLKSARSQRPSPFVDKTLYSGWNGMMISAFFEASVVLDDRRLAEIAGRVLEEILEKHRDTSGLVTHRSAAVGSEVFLDDQIHVAAACLDAYKITSSRWFLRSSEEIMNATMAAFWDEAGRGFDDVPVSRTALRVRHKPIHDSPSPGGNGAAASVLLNLATLAEHDRYRSIASTLLRSFSGPVKGNGLFAASYFRALNDFLHPPLHVVIPMDDSASGEELHQVALKAYRPGTLVSHIRKEDLPSFLQGSLPRSDGPVALVCSGTACAPPVRTPAALQSTIREFGRSAS